VLSLSDGRQRVIEAHRDIPDEQAADVGDFQAG
jgi:hypothetical protein